MKQKVNGQRVINWHRPLGKDELKQRYLRLKEAPYHEDIHPFPEPEQPKEDMFRCDLCWEQEDRLEPFEMLENEIRNKVLLQGKGTVSELIPEAQMARLQAIAQPDSRTSEVTRPPMPLQNKAALIKHFRFCIDEMQAEDWQSQGNLLKWIGIGEEKTSLAKVAGHLARSHERTILFMVCLRPFWIRDPEHWQHPGTDAQSALESLIRHLLVIYPVPEFFVSSLINSRFDLSSEQLHWFLLAAQGESMPKAAKLLGWRINRRYAHTFNVVAAQAKNFYDARIKTSLACLGVPMEFLELVQELSLELDPIRQIRNPASDDFSRRLVAWMVRESLSGADLRLVVAGARLLLDNLNGAELKKFVWKRRTRRSVLRYVQELIQREYARTNTREVWERKGWDAEWVDEAGDKWSMVELCDSYDLYLEGQLMHHCVGSYTECCVGGDMAIFSLRKNGVAVVTVEVDCNKRSIEFAGGLCNRELSPEEKETVWHWQWTFLCRLGKQEAEAHLLSA